MPKIQLDVDRKIYPSKNTNYQYQANAKKLSVFFNKKTVRGWEPGIWVCANHNSKEWWDINTKETSLYQKLPTTDKIIINGEHISYDYEDIEIRFYIGLDLLNRSIIIKNKDGINKLSQYIEFLTELTNLNCEIQDNKELHFKKNGQIELKNKVKLKARDSAKHLVLPPCRNKQNLTGAQLDKLCPEAKKANCKGCQQDTVNCCPIGRKTYYVPSVAEIEEIIYQDGKIKLFIENEWLNDPKRVFPIVIHDDITPEAGSITGTGKFDDGDAGNAFSYAAILDDDDDTFAGGQCSGNGNTSQIDISAEGIADHNIELDLGAVYTVESFVVRYMACRTPNCPNKLYDVKVQYKDGENWTDFGGNYLYEWSGPPEDTIQQQTYDVTDTSVRYVRIGIVQNSCTEDFNKCEITELTVYGSAAGGKISRYHNLSGLGGQGQMTFNPLG